MLSVDHNKYALSEEHQHQYLTWLDSAQCRCGSSLGAPLWHRAKHSMNHCHRYFDVFERDTVMYEKWSKIENGKKIMIHDTLKIWAIKVYCNTSTLYFSLSLKAHLLMYFNVFSIFLSCNIYKLFWIFISGFARNLLKL